MKKSELKQLIKEEISKILNENTKIDKQGNIIYSLYDENADWDFSDDENFMVTWVLDKDISNKNIQSKFDWDDENFNIEIPIKDIMNFLKNPTESIKNFKVPGGYIPITKKEAKDIIDSYYENWPDEINPDLN